MTFEQVKSIAIPVGASAATLLAATGILTPDQLASLKVDIAEVGRGMALVIHGGAGIVAIGLVIWTSIRTSRAALVARVQSSPTEHVVTSDPAIKAAVPDTIAGKPGEIVRVAIPDAPAKP